MTYDKDLVSESSQQLNQTILSNRRMTENSLRMRAMAYLAQAKANLLTETIFEVENSRKSIQKELLYKDEMVLVQSRYAAMGEMISMIAHQWRQPISTISMSANNILADVELDILDEDILVKNTKEILKQTQELSKTIDDFRGFFKPDKMIHEIFISQIIKDTLKIIDSSFINNNIALDIKFQETQKIETYARELMQVLINILNNAKDVLMQNDVENKKIFISEIIDDGKVVLKVCDNGGGVSEEIIAKIFEPYFTTKSEKNGTGLGLYMSKTIVERHLLGRLSVHNEKEGACFEITLPLTIVGRGDLR